MAIGISNNGSEGEKSIIYQRATIRTGDRKARITFRGENPPAPVTVLLEDLPEKPDIPPQTVIEDCLVVYDAGEEKVLAVNPWGGVFEAVGLGLGRDEEGRVQITEKTGIDKRSKEEYKYYKFFEEFEIVDKEEAAGMFVGGRPRWYLQFKFHRRPDGNTDISGTENSKWTVKLMKFGEVQGIYDEDIPWDEDDRFGGVLDTLDERIRSLKPRVRIQVSEGYIETILPSRASHAPKKAAPVEDEDVPEFMRDDPEPVRIASATKPSRAVVSPDDELE